MAKQTPEELSPAAPLAIEPWAQKFLDVKIPELARGAAGKFRICRLQREQCYALRVQLETLGYKSGDTLKTTDRFFCAKLIQVALVRPTGGQLVCPGDEWKLGLMQALSPERLVELATLVVDHNDLFNAPGPRPVLQIEVE